MEEKDFEKLVYCVNMLSNMSKEMLFELNHRGGTKIVKDAEEVIAKYPELTPSWYNNVPRK